MSKLRINFLQDNPDEVVRELEQEGVEAYRGATQLSTVFRTKEVGGREDAKKEENNVDAELCLANLLPETNAVTALNMSSASDLPKPSGTPRSLNMTSAQFMCSPPSASGTGTNSSLSREKDDVLFPHNAKYLIDHVVYLPVHKRVSFWYLEHICHAVENVMRKRKGVKIADTKNVLFQSKL